MNALGAILLLAAKDLRIEARRREAIGLVLVTGLLVVAVLGLGLGPGRSVHGAGAAAVLWVAYLFGGVLTFEKTFALERHDDALAALLLAPVDRGLIFGAKLIVNVVLMLALAAVVTPAAVVLFNFDLAPHAGAFARVMFLGILGFASVGTLFPAAAASSRPQGGLLALLVFPLTLPLVLVSSQLLNRVFAGAPEGAGTGVLIAFDVIFVVAGWLLFEFLLEP